MICAEISSGMNRSTISVYRVLSNDEAYKANRRTGGRRGTINQGN